jgi:hypothetical protein
LKQKHRIKHYARFANDFVLLSENKAVLEQLLPAIKKFLESHLKIELHPNKISLRPLHHGIDFLGYVTLPHHRVLRTTTKQRMKRKISARLAQYLDGEISHDSMNQTLQSYLGMLSHADAFHLSQEIRNQFCWR